MYECNKAKNKAGFLYLLNTPSLTPTLPSQNHSAHASGLLSEEMC